MQNLLRIIANAGVFVFLYIIFMMPTYILPYMGSNSSVINGLAQITKEGLNPSFLLHLGAFGVLIFLTFLRGVVINHKWIVIFPILAMVFDFFPLLNNIPLIPTLMHLLAIIIGVSLNK